MRSTKMFVNISQKELYILKWQHAVGINFAFFKKNSTYI